MSSPLSLTLHKESYPAIDPSRSEVSQRGRVVLITGSSAGIGLHIAKGFAKADASAIILTGRNQNRLDEAAKLLAKEYPKTNFKTRTLDISDLSSIDELWKALHGEGIVVDVLVLNASLVQTKEATILERNRDETIADFSFNVFSHLASVQKFYHQQGRDPSRKLALLNVSTFSVYDFDMNRPKPVYGASKNASALLLQLIAKDVPVTEMQVVSFHPGFVHTEGAIAMGFDDPNSPYLSNGNLPGDWAVWAASEEAAFLHGRFTWAEWDVTEMMTGEYRKRLDEDSGYLQIGGIRLP